MTETLGEFERIARYFMPLVTGFPGALGLTDDAAILDPGPGRELVVSTDSQVAGVHFFSNADPALIAAKILRSSVSDLAAMGADPLAYTLAAFWTGAEDSDWLSRFSYGLAREQAALGITLAGGDTVKAIGALSFSITVFGSLPKGEAIRRAGAQAGDLIAVTGSIGDAWLGRRLLEDPVFLQNCSFAKRDVEFLTERYWRPSPRCRTLALLRGQASAAIDISDGLIADLDHIATSSGIGMELDAASIPLSGAALRSAAYFSLVDLIAGGDDYEIALTISSGKEGILKEVARVSGVPITVVGRCLPGSGVRTRDRFGGLLPVERTGFRHF